MGQNRMDGELLKKLAKFKLLVKRTNGQSVEIAKIMSDKDYAAAALADAEESDSEDLILLALEIKDALGLLAPQPTKPAPEPAAVVPEPPKKEGKDNNRYLFGARG